ncbi:MAG TPA: DMT family transporter [Streptosporangiaceae bacterium]|nr:DMT family transporter [Streptosporangiaceae bacterium]
MIYGSIAALGWGFSAIAATNAARRAGTYIAVLSGQGVGVAVLVILAVFLHTSLDAIDAAAAIALVGAGLLGLLGYLTFYRALETGGAVGLISAISATYGGITTLLAVIVLGEHIGGSGAAGVVLAVTGVAIASAYSQAGAQAPAIAVAEPIVGVAPWPSRVRGLTRAGVPLALASAVTYGVGGFLLGDYSARAGALGSALVAHGASVTVLLLALPFLGRRQAWRTSGSSLVWATAAGLTDVVGLLAFSRGGQAGQVAVTAAVSSVYPAIPLVGGLVMFGERLGRRQVLGITLIIAGLVLLGLG